MKYILKLKINNKLENSIEEKENDFDILETEDKFIFKILKEKDNFIPEYLQEAYSKIDDVFKEIVFNKKENNISNLKEIKEKWIKTKKEIVFNSDEDSIVQFVIDISKYFESEECLSFLLKNFSFIPLFNLIDFENLAKNNGLEKNLKIYNLFFNNEIDYKIKFTYEEDMTREKKILFIGKEDNSFDIGSIRKKMRDELGIPSGSPFSLTFNISGEYIFTDKFDNLKVTFTIEGGKYIDKEYILNLVPNEKAEEKYD